MPRVHSPWKTGLLAMCLLLGAAIVHADDDSSIPPRGKYGRIRILANPPAIAYLGGENLGSTPVDTTVGSGRQTLTLMLNGEELVRQRVNIWPDSTLTFEKNLVMPYGSLLITTDPANCDCAIYLDSLDVGRTQGAPLTINNIRSGTRMIKVVYGKKSRDYTVVIIPQKTVELFANLKGE